MPENSTSCLRCTPRCLSNRLLAHVAAPVCFCSKPSSCCFVLVRDLLSVPRTHVPTLHLDVHVFWRLVLAGATECRMGCTRDHRGLRGTLGELAVGVLRRQLPPLAFTMTGERDKVKVGLGFDRLADVCNRFCSVCCLATAGFGPRLFLLVRFLVSLWFWWWSQKPFKGARRASRWIPYATT